MSNVIPYFVLAVVALGFFAIATPFLVVVMVKVNQSLRRIEIHMKTIMLKRRMIVQLQRNLSVVMSR